MKNKLKNQIIKIMAIITLIIMAMFSEVMGADDIVKTLFANKKIDAGMVKVSAENNYIDIFIQTYDGWEIVNANVAAGKSLSSIPVNKKGAPDINKFKYKSGDITGQTYQRFRVPFSEIGIEISTSGEASEHPFVIAANATLRINSGDGDYKKETAWAEGTRFVKKGTWATYSSLKLTIPADIPEDINNGNDDNSDSENPDDTNDDTITVTDNESSGVANSDDSEEDAVCFINAR